MTHSVSITICGAGISKPSAPSLPRLTGMVSVMALSNLLGAAHLSHFSASIFRNRCHSMFGKAPPESLSDIPGAFPINFIKEA